MGRYMSMGELLPMSLQDGLEKFRYDEVMKALT